MCLNPRTIKVKTKFILVGCGKCFECLQKRALEWAYRVTLESLLYKDNCVITLTYNDANLPTASCLVKRDLQLFIKRLRKSIGNDKVRFFACGEYGSKYGRPHYHIILFNYDFKDKYWFCRDNKGNDLYRSPQLEKLWQLGFSSIGEVNFYSAKYCAIYLQKPPKDGRPKQFTLMSRRPGIGFGAIKKEWLDSDKIYHNGKYIPIPRYFLDKLSKEFPILVENIKSSRVESISKFNDRELEAIELERRFQKLSKLQKIFGKELKDYFDIDFNRFDHTIEKRDILQSKDKFSKLVEEFIENFCKNT